MTRGSRGVRGVWAPYSPTIEGCLLAPVWVGGMGEAAKLPMLEVSSGSSRNGGSRVRADPLPHESEVRMTVYTYSPRIPG